MTVDKSRGQAFTVEAILASLIVIGTFVVITQTAAVAPLESETQSQVIQQETATLSNDLLETSAELGTVQKAVLRWHPTQQTFDGTKQGYDHYQTPPVDTAFGKAVADVFTSRGYLVNIDLVWTTHDGRKTQQYLYMGSPDTAAVTTSHTVTLMSTDTVSYTRNGASQSTTLQTVTEDPTTQFFADPTPTGTTTYQSIRVQMTVWTPAD
jgi:hypothetical protein